MPDVRSLSTGMKVALGASLLLLINSFFAWQSFEGIVSWSQWHGFLGVLLGLLTIVFIGWLAAPLFGVTMPELPVPYRTITLGVGVAILVIAVIKNLADDYSGWAAYVGVVLAAGAAAGAWMIAQEPETAAVAPTYTPPPASDTTPGDPV